MRKDRKGSVYRGLIYCMMLLVISTTVLTGCGEKDSPQITDIKIVKPLTDNQLFKIGEEICTVPEAMILVSAQKKVVEDVYGTEIWSVTTDTGSFESYIKSALKDFLAKMQCMKLMAFERQITPSGEEEEQLKHCAEIYMSDLTQEEKESLGVDEKDVYNMFLSYYYYNRLMDVLTSDMNMEISDSDARVIQTEQIFVRKTEKNQEKYLKGILKKAKADSSKFAAVAQKYSEAGKLERQLTREDLPESLEEAVFGLSTDEVSAILEAEEGYYIFHCLNDYDREATAANKAALIKEKKEQHFAQEYDHFVEELSARFNDKAWEAISLADCPAPAEADFFAIYQEEMKVK